MPGSAAAVNVVGGDLRRSVWLLAAPAVMEMLLQMSVGMADMVMVGTLGPAAIASVEISNRIIFFLISVFAAISVGATAVVAREIGAGEVEEANNAARQSLTLVVSLAFILGVLGVMFSQHVARFMMLFNDKPDLTVLSYSSAYIRIISMTVPLSMTMVCVNAILRGAGDTKTPMYVTGLANILNVIGNYLLIFGVGPFPQMGVAGAAAASATARAIGGMIVLTILFSGRFRLHLSLRDGFRLSRAMVKRILNVGIPAAVEQFILRGGQMLFGMIVAGLDTASIAAHAIALTAESLSFMPGFGFALAATTLVGQNLGAKNLQRAEESGLMASRTATLLMSTMGVAFFLFPEFFVRLFTRDPDVVYLGSICLRIVAISQPFLAQVMVMSGALRGAGDTKWVMVSTAIGIWGVRVISGYILAISLGWGLTGAWIAMTLDLIVRGILVRWRFGTGRWKTIRV